MRLPREHRQPPIASMRLHALLIFLLTGTAALAGTDAVSRDSTDENPTQAVSLREALRLVLAQNRELAAFDAEVRAADARILQARLLPNPEVGGEVENVAGSGQFQGTEAVETTLQLSQLIELGGKRHARTRVASKGRELAVWDYEQKRLAVLTETAQVFIDVLTAQHRIELIRQTVKLAQDFLPESQKRVEAGKASPAESIRGEIAVSSAQIELEQAERDLAAARELLVSFWGARVPQFASVSGDLDHTEPEAPSAPLLTGRLIANPQLARYETEIEQRQAQILLEHAQAAPDLTLAAGYRHFAETKDSAAVIGFSIPLPLFNRNQGAIREAQVQLEKTHELQAAATTRLDAELGQAYQTLLAAQREIATLQGKILPFAQEAYDTIHEGYGAGRFSFLELLEARSTLTSSRIQLLNAKRTYHRAVAEIEGVTGQAPTLHIKH